MKSKVIKQNDIKQDDFGFIKVKQYFNTKDFEQLSFAIVEIDGENKKVKQPSSNAMYYVLEGSGKFVIEDKEFEVAAGDLIFIPKGTTYQDFGTMKMACFNSPRFDADTIEYLS